jgi:hypothetical protein
MDFERVAVTPGNTTIIASDLLTPAIAGQWRYRCSQSTAGLLCSNSALPHSPNTTGVPQGELGYLTVWPSGENQPLASTLNSLEGEVKERSHGHCGHGRSH